MSEWQPIETAPKDGTVVLGCNADWDYYPFSMLWDERWGWRDPEWDGNHLPTHWQPLPTPPSRDR